MKRYSFILLLAGVFAIGIPVLGQHHEISKPTEAASQPGGPLRSATVTFGAFMSHPTACTTPTPCPVLDRFVPGTNAAAYNHHALVPEIATIAAGGTVNFIISGFHVVAIYDDGIQPSDIDISILVPPTTPTGPARVPAVFNDPAGRIYRGLDPATLPAGGPRSDRVEAFMFDRPGLYLVVCAVVSHFQDGMYGYVRVLPNNDAPAREIK
jgi:hypothetical protein